MEIKVEGLDELFKKLDSKIKKDPVRAMYAMLLTANDIVGEAKRRVPVDMSRLKTHITKQANFSKMEVRVGTNVKYAPYVEKGTRPHTPPMKPIREWAERKKMPEAAGAIWASIRKNGTKPHPFLAPAFYEKIWNLKKYFKAVFRK